MRVLVFLEHRDGEARPDALAVLSKASRLGATGVAAVIVGAGARQLSASAARFGASRVFVADDPRLADPLPQPRVDVLARLVRERAFDTVLFAQSVLAVDVAVGLAARLHAGVNLDLVELASDDGRLVGKRPALRDSVYVDVGWRSDLRLAVFRSGSFEPVPSEVAAEVDELQVELEAFSTAARLVERAQEAESESSIDGAEIIVTGGRGVGGPEGLVLLEQLAAALGGAVGTTRPVAEAGWYPRGSMIGQTGRTVRPRLYVACGVSGAVQHRVGIQGSSVIVAINKDPDAPIFSFADLGVVGDLHEVVPRLTELVRARTGC